MHELMPAKVPFSKSPMILEEKHIKISGTFVFSDFVKALFEEFPSETSSACEINRCESRMPD